MPQFSEQVVSVLKPLAERIEHTLFLKLLKILSTEIPLLKSLIPISENILPGFPSVTSFILKSINKRLSSVNAEASGDKIAAAALKTVNEEWITKYGMPAGAVSLLAKGNKETIYESLPPHYAARRAAGQNGIVRVDVYV